MSPQNKDLDPAFLDSFLHIDSEFNMESLYGYIEGTGRPDDIAGWTTHLSECARCREYVAEFTEEWKDFNAPDACPDNRHPSK